MMTETELGMEMETEETTDMENPFDKPEIIEAVLKFLPAKSLIQTRRVSRTWNAEVIRKVRLGHEKGVNILKNIAHIGKYGEGGSVSYNYPVKAESVLAKSDIPDVLLHTIWINGELKAEPMNTTRGEVINPEDRNVKPEMLSMFIKYGSHFKILRLFYAHDLCVPLLGQILNNYCPNLRELYILNMKYIFDCAHSNTRCGREVEKFCVLDTLKLNKLVMSIPGKDWGDWPTILKLYKKILQGSPNLTYLSAPYEILSQMSQSTADNISTLIVRLRSSSILLLEQKRFKKLKFLKIVTNKFKLDRYWLTQVLNNLLNREDALSILELLAGDEMHYKIIRGKC